MPRGGYQPRGAPSVKDRQREAASKISKVLRQNVLKRNRFNFLPLPDPDDEEMEYFNTPLV